jgi:hypothetical protein
VKRPIDPAEFNGNVLVEWLKDQRVRLLEYFPSSD